MRPAQAQAEEVEVVAPPAPSALPLESDGYPRRKQPVHPNTHLYHAAKPSTNPSRPLALLQHGHSIV